jgi:hypothetical protein
MKWAALCLTLLMPSLAWAEFDHRIWDELLKRHVVLLDGGKASQVRYATLAKERALLRTYLEGLSRVTKAEFDAWPTSEQLAFLINAYNAFTVELVLTEYPEIDSIKRIGGWLSSPWKRKFFVLLGEQRSLDDIEHGLIRADGVYNEPRIHFAVVCASIGCPGLRDEAFAGKRLDAQLEDSTRKFLSDRTRNRFDRRTATLYVSRIFDWYQIDFTRGWRGYRSVPQFLAAYANALADGAADREMIEQQRAAIRFLEYDWKLNDVRTP